MASCIAGIRVQLLWITSRLKSVSPDFDSTRIGTADRVPGSVSGAHPNIGRRVRSSALSTVRLVHAGPSWPPTECARADAQDRCQSFRENKFPHAEALRRRTLPASLCFAAIHACRLGEFPAILPRSESMEGGDGVESNFALLQTGEAGFVCRCSLPPGNRGRVERQSGVVATWHSIAWFSSPVRLSGLSEQGVP